MLIKALPLFLSCILLLGSCTSSRLVSDVRPSEVKDLQLVTPFSYIHFIKNGNKGALSDTLSDMSEKLVLKVMEDYQRQNRLPITGNLFIEDSLLNKQIERQIESLCMVAEQRRSLTNLQIPAALDSLLEMNGKRFGLITVATGFTRVKGNYGGQAAKAVAIGVLTLGLFAPIPVKSNSTIYALIVDAEKNNIAFFRKVYETEKDPLDKAVLRRQLDKMFTGYFWE